MKNPLKNYIRKLLLEVFDENAIKPAFQELKEYRIHNAKKTTIYDIIDTFPIEKYTINIDYCDAKLQGEARQKIEVKSLSDLKYRLMGFVPEHSHFSSINFSVEYKHQLGKQSKFQSIVSSMDNKVYKSTELDKIFSPMLEWINKRPELLV